MLLVLNSPARIQELSVNQHACALLSGETSLGIIDAHGTEAISANDSSVTLCPDLVVPDEAHYLRLGTFLGKKSALLQSRRRPGDVLAVSRQSMFLAGLLRTRRPH